MKKQIRSRSQLRELAGDVLAAVTGGVTATEKPSGQTASGSSTPAGTSQGTTGGKTQTTGSVLDNASF